MSCNKIFKYERKLSQSGGTNDIYKKKLDYYNSIATADPYSVLGLKKGAPIDEVTKKYNELIKEYSPKDIPCDDATANKTTCSKEKNKEIYTKISNLLFDSYITILLQIDKELYKQQKYREILGVSPEASTNEIHHTAVKIKIDLDYPYKPTDPKLVAKQTEYRNLIGDTERKLEAAALIEQQEKLTPLLTKIKKLYEEKKYNEIYDLPQEASTAEINAAYKKLFEKIKKMEYTNYSSDRNLGQSYEDLKKIANDAYYKALVTPRNKENYAELSKKYDEIKDKDAYQILDLSRDREITSNDIWNGGEKFRDLQRSMMYQSLNDENRELLQKILDKVSAAKKEVESDLPKKKELEPKKESWCTIL